ncbi:hypothetical protein BU24DRAFT_408550 [Aaosphaeria arxii CBS 175.79]|uniref:Uncharacterized protein n=1 Tax=Aaosphaeria arxii CBS 175.79 TaxID=1450172 RepID=A0A6A5XSV5_9PLEO|nr:uncharacterized protein BU24DRAFT_408550 [Aaosphaeria arxii CBS 175.79]KAF2015324.1 hypothetical protein BU24DRAFT_408550 [Aaosphaeria arxii CBS 175.79]
MPPHQQLATITPDTCGVKAKFGDSQPMYIYCDLCVYKLRNIIIIQEGDQDIRDSPEFHFTILETINGLFPDDKYAEWFPWQRRDYGIDDSDKDIYRWASCCEEGMATKRFRALIDIFFEKYADEEVNGVEEGSLPLNHIFRIPSRYRRRRSRLLEEEVSTRVELDSELRNPSGIVESVEHDDEE